MLMFIAFIMMITYIIIAVIDIIIKCFAMIIAMVIDNSVASAIIIIIIPIKCCYCYS